MSKLSHYLFYPLALTLAYLIVHDSAEGDRLLRLAAEMQSMSGAATLAWEALLERLSFSWYSGASDLADAYHHVVTQGSATVGRAIQLSLGLFALSTVQLLYIFTSTRRSAATLAWHLNLTAALTLGVGIVAPMLTVTALAEIPVLGEVILRYETKSILTTVRDLGASGDTLLAAIIATFSIVVPLTKVALLTVVSWHAGPRWRRRGLRMLHAIGKWSMADVFVVAVLVAFLALNKDAHSDAEIGLGLYFFAAYCALSMSATQLLTVSIPNQLLPALNRAKDDAPP
jgi:paraquat-inducible protein A